jgi:hypothetical protein
VLKIYKVVVYTAKEGRYIAGLRQTSVKKVKLSLEILNPTLPAYTTNNCVFKRKGLAYKKIKYLLKMHMNENLI